MVPMAIGMGEGGEQNAPLGRAVIGGLLFATVATLFFVPSVFAIIRNQKNPGLQQFPHLLEIDAIIVQEKALRLAKRGVDDGGDCRRIPHFGCTYRQRSWPVARRFHKGIESFPESY